MSHWSMLLGSFLCAYEVHICYNTCIILHVISKVKMQGQHVLGSFMECVSLPLLPLYLQPGANTELVNHCIKYFPENAELLFPSWSKLCCWAKLCPEQNISPGHGAVRGADAADGLILPYLQEPPQQLLFLAAGRDACGKGRSVKWIKTPAAEGWVRERGCRGRGLC